MSGAEHFLKKRVKFMEHVKYVNHLETPLKLSSIVLWRNTQKAGRVGSSLQTFSDRTKWDLFREQQAQRMSHTYVSVKVRVRVSWERLLRLDDVITALCNLSEVSSCKRWRCKCQTRQRFPLRETTSRRVQFLWSSQCPLLMSKWPRSKWERFCNVILEFSSTLVTGSLKTSCGSKFKFLWRPSLTPCSKATGWIQTPGTWHQVSDASALLQTMFWSSIIGALACLRTAGRPKRGCNKADEKLSCYRTCLMLAAVIDAQGFNPHCSFSCL